jgi:hypothetical protein
MANNDAFENWLSQQLRDADDYIDDNGFTDAVMEKLPAKPLFAPQKTSRIPTLLALLFSSALVISVFPVGYVVESVFFTQVSFFTLALAGVAFSTLTGAFAIFANKHV